MTNEILGWLQKQSIFSEKVTDNLLSDETVKSALADSKFFAIEALPGQFESTCYPQQKKPYSY